MITDINTNELAALYGMSASNLQTYLAPHREKLKELATKREVKGKVRKSRKLNSDQLKYIVENIIKHTPLGYEFDGNTFVKKNDYV